MTQNSVTGELEGAEALLRKLQGVSDDVKLKGGRFALRKAGNVMRDAVVGEMQRYDQESSREAIYKNVAMKFSPRKFKATGDLMFRLGILGGAKSKREKNPNSPLPGGDTFYWRFLEFGTRHAPAQRPITNTVRRKESAIIFTFIREYNKALDRAIRKAARGRKQ